MKYRRMIVKFIINHFLCATRFFEIKRSLLNWAGIKAGAGTKVVGPMYFGNVVSISIGDHCWVGKNLYIEGNGKVVIGDNVDIAPHVVLETGGHLTGTSGRRAGEGLINTISIGDGVWIGVRSTIINSVNIAEGGIVAAGALVRADVSDNKLVAGVPAIEKKELP